MLRRVVSFAAVVSLAFCVAAVVLAVRSRERVEGWERLLVDTSRGFMRADALAVNDGELTFFRATITFEPVDPRSGYQFPYPSHGFRYFEDGKPRDWGFGPGPSWERSGFRFRREQDAPFRTRWWIAVPLWALALTFALPPAFLLYRKTRRRRQARAGRCPSCNYDVRATPGRCPECGAVPAAAASAAGAKAGG